MIARVMEVRDLTQSAYVLRVERAGLEFQPGQYVTVGPTGSLSTREYTVYSTPEDPYVEVLIKETVGGLVSGALRRTSPGDPLDMEGPFGKFVIPPTSRRGRSLLFMASGTGVSPFHCFARSYPGLDYLLIHGVRTAEELYGREFFPAGRHVSCVSRGPGGDHRGRVTDWLREHDVPPDTPCYLCGNSDMIYEVMALLRERGIAREQIYAEIYF